MRARPGQAESRRPESIEATACAAELATLLAPRGLTRRRFLRASGSGVLLLAVGAVLPSGCRQYPAPREQLAYLTDMEYAVVNAAAAQILGLAREDLDRVDVALFVDRFVADFDRDVRRQVRLMLRVFEHGTHIFDLKRVRFTALSPAERDRYLEGWMDSSIGARRVVFRALKAMSALGFYSRPASWDAIGYDGPWLGRLPIDPAPPTIVATPWAELRAERSVPGRVARASTHRRVIAEPAAARSGSVERRPA